MILISHRGNLSGRNPERENTKEYIEEALAAGYYVEFDLWFFQGEFYMGHSDQSLSPKIDKAWILKYREKLLIHCKSLEAAKECQDIGDVNFFFHDKDEYVVSYFGWIIAHSNNSERPFKYKNTICMLPEIHGFSKESVKNCAGVCSDIVSFYK